MNLRKFNWTYFNQIECFDGAAFIVEVLAWALFRTLGWTKASAWASFANSQPASPYHVPHCSLELRIRNCAISAGVCLSQNILPKFVADHSFPSILGALRVEKSLKVGSVEKAVTVNIDNFECFLNICVVH